MPRQVAGPSFGVSSSSNFGEQARSLDELAILSLLFSFRVKHNLWSWALFSYCVGAGNYGGSTAVTSQAGGRKNGEGASGGYIKGLLVEGVGGQNFGKG